MDRRHSGNSEGGGSQATSIPPSQLLMMEGKGRGVVEETGPPGAESLPGPRAQTEASAPQTGTQSQQWRWLGCQSGSLLQVAGGHMQFPMSGAQSPFPSLVPHPLPLLQR